MTAPVRIQLSRRRGFNLQAASMALNGLPAVKVTRPGRWGNPFNLKSSAHCWTALSHGFRADAKGRQAASVAIFRAWVLNGKPDGVDCGLSVEANGNVQRISSSPAIEAGAPPTMEEIRVELAGRNLACWCPLTDAKGKRVPCHADVLLQIAAGAT